MISVAEVRNAHFTQFPQDLDSPDPQTSQPLSGSATLQLDSEPVKWIDGMTVKNSLKCEEPKNMQKELWTIPNFNEQYCCSRKVAFQRLTH